MQVSFALALLEMMSMTRVRYFEFDFDKAQYSTICGDCAERMEFRSEDTECCRFGEEKVD